MITRTSLAVILLSSAAAGISYAKNVNFTPDMSSAEYWDTHHVAAVRITAVRRTAGGPEEVTWHVESALSDSAIEATVTAPLSHLWFGGVEEQHHPSAEDRLAIFYARDGRSPIAAIPLNPKLAESLRGIARLRGTPGDFEAYWNAAVSADPLVARYAMRYLLGQTASLQASAATVAKLLAARDDEARETADRILTGRLAYRLQGLGDASDEEYEWLAATLAGSPGKSWTELKPVANRLLEFDNRRTETIALLTQLATNPGVAQSIRIAAYGPFMDARLFRFEAPDAGSARIFRACQEMLGDADPLMRRAGAALLHGVTVRVNAGDRPEYLAQARKAISEALATESDETARFHFSHFLSLLAQ